jgi:hypothetical protein
VATEQTARLAKRAAQAGRGGKQCWLRRDLPGGAYETQVAWLPAEVRKGQTVAVGGVEWVVVEAYG